MTSSVAESVFAPGAAWAWVYDIAVLMSGSAYLNIGY